MDEYLTTAELSAEIRTPAETLRYWRYVERGPKSFKLGRRVLYSRADVNEWIRAARENGAVTVPHAGQVCPAGGSS